eukprot:scaffold92385_cov27-Prasinocladus_malaysianus.AAC.1
MKHYSQLEQPTIHLLEKLDPADELRVPRAGVYPAHVPDLEGGRPRANLLLPSGGKQPPTGHDVHSHEPGGVCRPGDSAAELLVDDDRPAVLASKHNLAISRRAAGGVGGDAVLAGFHRPLLLKEVEALPTRNAHVAGVGS